MKTQTSLSPLFQKLAARLAHFQRLETMSWAGCSSEDAQETSDKGKAYVMEPRLSIRNSKEARALILAITRSGMNYDALYPLLFSYQERIKRMKEPIYERLKIALQFLLDRNFSPESPTRQAIEGILHFTERSYNGNDLNLAHEVLRRSEIKIRVLSNSKNRKPGVPKRPKERAEPTHDWLPSWQKQYIAEPPTSSEEDEVPIWELLSPSEVAFHFGR